MSDWSWLILILLCWALIILIKTPGLFTKPPWRKNQKTESFFLFDWISLQLSALSILYMEGTGRMRSILFVLFPVRFDFKPSPWQLPRGLDCTKTSGSPCEWSFMVCRGRTFWNLSNSHCKSGYTTGNIIMPRGPYLFATELVVSWQERANNLTGAELHNLMVVSFTISFLFHDCSTM